MELFLFLGSLFAFLFVGIPISMVLVLCSIVLMWHSGMWDSMIIPSTMLDGANNYPLMAIPFFVFAGEIMAEGGLSKRAHDRSRARWSWLCRHHLQRDLCRSDGQLRG